MWANIQIQQHDTRRQKRSRSETASEALKPWSTVSSVQVCQVFTPWVTRVGVDGFDKEEYAKTVKDAILQALECAGGIKYVLEDGAISDKME
jgi:hypothetical protein